MSSSCPFNYWKTNVILQLKHLDLWDVVSGMFEEPERGDTLFKEWKQKDQHAFFLLHRSLSYSQADRLGPIENIENSQQLWTAILRNNSDIVSKTSYLRFLNDLSRIWWEQNEDFTQFYNRLDFIVSKIRSVQQNAIRPIDVMVKILENLPFHYKEVKFEIKYLMKKWARDELAPSDDVQLQQIISELHLSNSKKVFQKSMGKQIKKRSLSALFSLSSSLQYLTDIVEGIKKQTLQSFWKKERKYHNPSWIPAYLKTMF